MEFNTQLAAEDLISMNQCREIFTKDDAAPLLETYAAGRHLIPADTRTTADEAATYFEAL